MNLLTPIALFFLLTIPVVILFYLLRLRRKELIVSSTLLWQHMTQDIQANAPFQRLRKNLLLLLQIIVLALVAFALARPFLRVHALTAERTVLILDTSASMQATDVMPSRLAAAKREALRMVDDLSRGDKMMIISAGARTETLSAFTDNKRALKAAVNGISAADTTTQLREAVVLALSMGQTGGAGQGDIYLLSDGAFEPLEDLHLGTARLHFVRFGRAADNVGITALDIRQTFAERFKDQILVAVANFSDRPRPLDLELYRDGSLFDVRQITVPPGRSKSEIFEDFEFESGTIEARLDLDDDLDVDNRAYACMAPRIDVSALLVTRGNVVLEKVLNAHRHVSLAKAAPTADIAAGNYDVLVLDRVAPARLPAKPALLVGVAPDGAPVELVGDVDNPTVLDWDRQHPVTRYVNFGDVNILSTKLARPLPWGRVLVKAGGTPLVVAGEKGGMRRLYLGIPAHYTGSDFPFTVGFPIFVSNALEWLVHGAEARNVQYRTGSVVPLDPPKHARRLKVSTPEGAEHELDAPDGQRVLFDDTDRSGVYTVTDGESQRRFAVNLLSKAESDTAPQDNVSLGRENVASAGSRATSNREVWRLLALVAVLVLTVEWYLYHRRI